MMKSCDEFLINRVNICSQLDRLKVDAGILKWYYSRKQALLRFIFLALNWLLIIFSIYLKLNAVSIICIVYFVIDYCLHRYINMQEHKKGLMLLSKILEKDMFYSVYESRQGGTVDEEVRKEYMGSSRKGFIRVGFETNAYKEIALKKLFDSLDFKDKSVLDVGCGTGEILMQVAGRNAGRITGVDINAKFVKVVKELGFEAFQCKVWDLPFESNTFDIVIFTEVVEHLHDPIRALKEVRRVLKSGGLLIMTTANNRAVLTSFCINPLIFIEKIAGNYYDGILPLRRVVSTDEYTFYHTTYSRAEIFNIVNNVGFSKISLNTFGQLIFLSLVIPLEGVIVLEKVLTRIIPLLKYNGSVIMILCRK